MDSCSDLNWDKDSFIGGCWFYIEHWLINCGNFKFLRALRFLWPAGAFDIYGC